jgi:hypothetical protein
MPRIPARYLTASFTVLLTACTDVTSPRLGPNNTRADDAAINSTTSTECIAPMTGTFDEVVVPAGGNCKLILSEVSGSVRVLAGGSLEVLGSRIEHDVAAEDGHLSLGIGGIPAGGGIVGSFVGGDVIARGTAAVLAPYGVNYLCNTRVEHDVRITDAGADAPWDVGVIPFPCTFGNSIGGSVRVMRNEARVRVANNTPANSPSGELGQGGIGGGIFFIRNASLLGPHLILNNTVETNVLVISTDGGVAVTGNTIGNNLICQNNTPPAVDAGNVVGGQDNCAR